MYNELLSQLENKIQDAVETIEIYRMEIAELKEKNSELENQHQVWEEKLSSLISKFESVNEQEDDTKDESYESPNSEATDTQISAMESAAEDDARDDSEASSTYSSTTSIGNQAVASSTHYSSYDE